MKFTYWINTLCIASAKFSAFFTLGIGTERVAAVDEMAVVEVPLPVYWVLLIRTSGAVGLMLMIVLGVCTSTDTILARGMVNLPYSVDRPPST